MNWLNRYSNVTYALFRVFAGVLFLLHGTQKTLGFPPSAQGGTMPIASLPGFAGIIELICGALIALGLLTGIAAFIASGEMAVAYFMAHASHNFWPIVNKGELAVLYCFAFLYIASVGGGRFSLDAMIRRGEGQK